jgi:hypothetical protein
MMLIQLQLSVLNSSRQDTFLPKKDHHAPQDHQSSTNSINTETFSDKPLKMFQEEKNVSSINSLSNMIETNADSTMLQNTTQENEKFWTDDPIAANLTSCLCKRLQLSCNNCEHFSDISQQNTACR